MIYRCTDRRGRAVDHPMSDELKPEEAMRRLGVLDGPWTVDRYPEKGRGVRERIQTYVLSDRGNRTVRGDV